MSEVTVTGIDGHAPVYDTNSLWKIWNLKEIYLGKEGKNKYVPKIEDLVLDMTDGQFYKVVDIESSTMIARMIPFNFINSNSTSKKEDFLLGAGPGTQSDTYRIYIDQTVVPFALCVDQRLKVNGVRARYAKIFAGSKLDGDEEVISLMYDANKQLIGNEIPLDNLVPPLENLPNTIVPAGVDWYAVKAIPPCYTNRRLKDGDLVTAVIYGDEGHVISKRQLIVENTGFIRAVKDGVKYVSHISLDSPFLSDTVPNLIEYPINVPLVGLNLMGRVHYSDGSISDPIPVDGTRFSVMGLNDYVSTISGHRFDITLRYNLRRDEVAYGTHVGEDKFITEQYHVKTMPSENIYSVKLFCFPVWIDQVSGYRLEWYMYNIVRDRYTLVTPFVRYNDTSAVFNPLGLGVNQRLSVRVNLKEVNTSLKDYRHVQVMDITLLRQGTENGTKWIVNDYGAKIAYGRDLQATYRQVNQNLKYINIASGFSNLNEWLEKVFYLTNPLINEELETKVPEPDVMTIIIGNHKVIVDVKNWNKDIMITTPPLRNYQTIFIAFGRATPDGVMEIGMGAMPLKQIN